MKVDFSEHNLVIGKEKIESKGTDCKKNTLNLLDTIWMNF